MSTPNGIDIAPNASKTLQQGTRLEAKRIDKVQIPKTGEWQIVENGGPEPGSGAESNIYAKYADYAFIVRRKRQQSRQSDVPTITTKILIQSEPLLSAVGEVLKDVQGLTWNARPFKVMWHPLGIPTEVIKVNVQVDPQLLLAFLSRFKDYLADLRSKDTASGDGRREEHLFFLISFLDTEYATTIRKINDLVPHGQITFDLLWAILLPHSILFTTCETTNEPRAVRLRDLKKESHWLDGESWQLSCDYVDAIGDSPSPRPQFEWADVSLKIQNFDGVVNITQLSLYPIKFHPNGDEVRANLIARGRRWIDWNGFHHVHYSGVACKRENNGITRLTVNGRIIIDRCTFVKAEPNYLRRSRTRRRLVDLVMGAILSPGGMDDDILLCPPTLYGFSLVDKRWLEFNVEKVSKIAWNDKVFKNLAMDHGRKVLVQSLIKSHADHPLDDFVTGKGLGLVINLFGPPGVGKSLTVEATSEHLRKPLYVVSAGDLGTNASKLDQALTEIFALAPVWGAVVLIDEADVFLEKRGASDLERNAMVAVFLRQIEYFRGILFLTTNRVKAFDQAFQSRIHLSLHYGELTNAAKEDIWTAFLDKVRTTGRQVHNLTQDELRELSVKDMNGREIKNVVKLAVALAEQENEPLGFKQLVRTMNTMRDCQTTGSVVPRRTFQLSRIQSRFYVLGSLYVLAFAIALYLFFSFGYKRTFRLIEYMHPSILYS